MQLLHLSKGEELFAEARSIVQKAHPSLIETLKACVKGLEQLLNHIGPAVGRIQQSVLGPLSAVPFTQYAGGIQQ